ncbi:MAG: hypothetical protein RIR40_922, partial [Actinomycetota bacterium]
MKKTVLLLISLFLVSNLVACTTDGGAPSSEPQGESSNSNLPV